MTAGGLKVEINAGRLHILEEGKKLKFKNSLAQVTFSAEYSKSGGQRVLFVTERCVFEIVENGLMLIEIAPGIDLERDILDLMEFRPLISENLKTMDERIFRNEIMGLNEILKDK